MVKVKENISRVATINNNSFTVDTPPTVFVYFGGSTEKVINPYKIPSSDLTMGTKVLLLMEDRGVGWVWAIQGVIPKEEEKGDDSMEKAHTTGHGKMKENRSRVSMVVHPDVVSGQMMVSMVGQYDNMEEKNGHLYFKDEQGRVLSRFPDNAQTQVEYLGYLTDEEAQEMVKRRMQARNSNAFTTSKSSTNGPKQTTYVNDTYEEELAEDELEDDINGEYDIEGEEEESMAETLNGLVGSFIHNIGLSQAGIKEGMRQTQEELDHLRGLANRYDVPERTKQQMVRSIKYLEKNLRMLRNMLNSDR